jgi:hypothetical protein
VRTAVAGAVTRRQAGSEDPIEQGARFRAGSMGTCYPPTRGLEQIPRDWRCRRDGTLLMCLPRDRGGVHDDRAKCANARSEVADRPGRNHAFYRPR